MALTTRNYGGDGPGYAWRFPLTEVKTLGFRSESLSGTLAAIRINGTVVGGPAVPAESGIDSPDISLPPGDYWNQYTIYLGDAEGTSWIIGARFVSKSGLVSQSDLTNSGGLKPKAETVDSVRVVAIGAAYDNGSGNIVGSGQIWGLSIQTSDD
jgi:hypothetical protein